MDEHVLTVTRRSLHAVAEQLLAGPQHRTQGTIRLRIAPGGFGQIAGPWRVDGGELVGPDLRVVRLHRTGTQREGPFWNAAFGSLRPAAELPDTAAVATYFAAGRDAAAGG